jgi:hypothetical protein
MKYVLPILIPLILCAAAVVTPSCSKTGNLPFLSAVQKADSCYFAQDYKQANDYYRQAFKAQDADLQNSHYTNAASVAALSGDTRTALLRLNQLIEKDPDWYVNNLLDNPDYALLHQCPEWQAIVDTVQQRSARIEKDYDHELIARLEAIFRRDQQPRHAFIYACQTEPDNTQLRDSLIREMQQADAVNIPEIKDILLTYGFPPKSRVGQANTVIWLIIQHSDLSFQKECFPMLQDAAEAGELSKETLAMLEDRINMFDGLPQRYGSQIVDDSAGNRVVYTLLCKDSVDAWRAAAGMPPLATYAEQMHAIIR